MRHLFFPPYTFLSRSLCSKSASEAECVHVTGMAGHIHGAPKHRHFDAIIIISFVALERMVWQQSIALR